MPRAGAPTPFRDGFAAVQHEPALLGAEITWRWCFGFSALVLIAFSSGLFLNSLKVSKLDQLLLSTLQPQLFVRGFRDIFHGSLSRLLLLDALLVVGLTLLWSFASAIGRAAILRRLLEMFSTADAPGIQAMEWRLRPLFLLELLRAMWAQIAIYVTVVIFLYGVVMAADERPFAAAFSLSFGVGIACLTGFFLNWYLGLAPLFCLRNGVGAREAVEQAVEFSGRHRGRLSLIGMGFFVVRLIWTVAMAAIVLAPLSLAGKVGGRWIFPLIALSALTYFAGVDLLRLARWGAYVSLLEDTLHLAPPVAVEVPPPALPPDILPLEGLA